jgi:hypothetical protein
MDTNTEHYKKQLAKHLDALDAHSMETRRMLDTKALYSESVWGARLAERDDLVANLIVAARTLVSLPPEAPVLSECAACRDLGEVAP